MCCTGSEANDIALRMAQAVTGKTGIIATDNTYHGNTAATSVAVHAPPADRGISGACAAGARAGFAAPVGGTVEGQAQAFAAEVARAIGELEAAGHGFSGMMLCPVFANEGSRRCAPGFLDPTVAVIRRAGGLILCDEVQPGFGRVGSHFWGHDWLGFAPDVVTVGKPMANGHPVAAVLARPDVMAAFREAFGYFNTFGGNPVSAAACLAVLEVIREEGLQENAARVERAHDGPAARAAPSAAGRGAGDGAVLRRGVRAGRAHDARHGVRRRGGGADGGARVPAEPDRAGGQHAEDPPADAVLGRDMPTCWRTRWKRCWPTRRWRRERRGRGGGAGLWRAASCG